MSPSKKRPVLKRNTPKARNTQQQDAKIKKPKTKKNHRDGKQNSTITQIIHTLKKYTYKHRIPLATVAAAGVYLMSQTRDRTQKGNIKAKVLRHRVGHSENRGTVRQPIVDLGGESRSERYIEKKSHWLVDYDLMSDKHPSGQFDPTTTPPRRRHQQAHGSCSFEGQGHRHESSRVAIQ